MQLTDNEKGFVRAAYGCDYDTLVMIGRKRSQPVSAAARAMVKAIAIVVAGCRKDTAVFVRKMEETGQE